MKNWYFEQFKELNPKEDAKAPQKKLRVAVVSMKLAFKDDKRSKVQSGIPEGADYESEKKSRIT